MLVKKVIKKACKKKHRVKNNKFKNKISCISWKINCYARENLYRNCWYMIDYRITMRNAH